MKIKLNRKSHGYAWLVCLGLAGIIIFAGIIVYIVIRCCDHIPPPQPRADDPWTNPYNANCEIDIHISGAPLDGKGYVRAGLLSWDGQSNFVIAVLRHDSLVGFRTNATIYYLTGCVSGVSNNVATQAVIKAYSEGQLVSSNVWGAAP